MALPVCIPTPSAPRRSGRAFDDFMKTCPLLLAVLMMLCSATAAEPANERVTLLQMLAQPEKYDKKEIQIIGYLHLEFEGNGLYLHKEDYNHGIIGNVIWVEATEKMEKDKKDLNDKYVI